MHFVVWVKYIIVVLEANISGLHCVYFAIQKSQKNDGDWLFMWAEYTDLKRYHFPPPQMIYTLSFNYKFDRWCRETF